MKLEATTIQSHHIKQFFSSLKEQINDTDLECTPTGIRILAIDTTRIVCVHAELNGSSFEKYECKQSFTIGIDVMSINKILKHTVNGDILTLFVDSDENYEYTGDRLGIKIRNDQKGEDCTFYIDAIDTNIDTFRPEELNYPVNLSMPSNDLQSIIGRLKNTGSDVLQLVYKNGELKFFAKGDVAQATINRRKPDNNTNHNNICVKRDDNDTLIMVYLGINKISEFTKCTVLSQYVTIYLQNDNPVFFEYQIGSLGQIRLGLSPRSVPENW